jgi:hypothetical protein
MTNCFFRLFALVISIIFFSAPFSAAQESPQNTASTPPAAVDPSDEYGIIETSLSCEEVNQISHRSIQRLGYKIDSFTPAAGDKPGLIKASRTFVWGDKEPVTVKIACKTGGIAVDARPDIPPCEQANRISRLAVEHLGYTVTEFTPAAVGKPGIVKGKKDKEPEVFITLFCEGRMVTMDTSMDSPLLRNSEFYTALTDFRRGFFATYKAQRGVVVPSTTATSGDQLQVFMRPLSKSDAKAALGAEITTMLTVQVEIANPTKRSYQLDPEKILLVSIGGERIKPLPEKDNTFPVHALTNQSVAPGGQVKGYLYYPLGTYTGARGALIEEKSQEREGFEVLF